MPWQGCLSTRLGFHKDGRGRFGGYKGQFWAEVVVSFSPWWYLRVKRALHGVIGQYKLNYTGYFSLSVYFHIEVGSSPVFVQGTISALKLYGMTSTDCDSTA